MKAKFSLPIYRCEIWLIVADTVREGVRQLPTTFDRDDANAADDGAGLMVSDDMGGFAIVLAKEHIDANTIAHEVFHLTVEILNRCGIEITVDNDEVAAHLNGYLTELITDKLKGWKV